MFAFIKKTVADLQLENVKVVKSDVFKYIAQCNEQYNFIFAGPPYALTTIDDLPKIIVEKKLIAPKGYFVLEHTPRNNYESFEGFQFQRNYGTTVFSFFRNE